jgi:hypothetical protein
MPATDGRYPGRETTVISTTTVTITGTSAFSTLRSLLGAWVENYSQHKHETIHDLCAECPSVSGKYVT